MGALTRREWTLIGLVLLSLVCGFLAVKSLMLLQLVCWQFANAGPARCALERYYPL